MILLSLVGEQPIPNLLVPRALKPAECVWAHTRRTAPMADRLRRLVDPIPSTQLRVEPYDIAATEQTLEAWAAGLAPGATVEVNLTGGTKPMALAAERLASRRSFPLLYLQTEGPRVRLHRFLPTPAGLGLDQVRTLPPQLTIADYLRAHGLWEWRVKAGTRSPFERLVDPVLHLACNEVQANLDFDAFEIDFLVRRRNHVGVVECKSGRWKQANAKRGGIDQLVIATDSRYLGTYTRRFLVTDSPLSANLTALAEARQVTLVVLASAAQSGMRWLSTADRTRLERAIETLQTDA